jgi:hypothetical protein
MELEALMTYRGHVKNGVVVLDEPMKLPEGAEVRVDTVDLSEQDQKDFESLRAGLLKVSGAVKDMPNDMSKNHDHFAHGAPKRP